MYYRIFVALGILVLLAGCKPGPTALEYSNKLVSITDSLHAKGTRWGQELVKGAETKDFSKLAPIRTDLQSFISAKTDELIADKDVHGSADLKKAMLDFLNYEQIMVETSFKPVEQLNSNSTPEDLNAVVERIKEASQKEDVLLDRTREVQREYAAKNHFSIKTAGSR